MPTLELMMSDLDRFRLLEQAASRLRNIRARTWLILGAVALGLVSLLVWAGVAILSWLWSEAPTVAEAGRRLSGEAITQAERVAPGLKERVEQWAPGMKAQIDRVLPGKGEAPPAKDVSGTDVGPMPRFPGLVRTYFVRQGQMIEARYAGRAEFGTVLAYYVQKFAAAGYAQEVMSATPEEEQHRFRRGQESIDLSIMRRPGGLLELYLKQR
jgi:hypothetical protein